MLFYFPGTIMGFEPLANQRLLPPSFPRYTAIFAREQVSANITSTTSLPTTNEAVAQLSVHENSTLSSHEVLQRRCVVFSVKGFNHLLNHQYALQFAQLKSKRMEHFPSCHICDQADMVKNKSSNYLFD